MAGYRLAMGDRLLLEMWEPHQTSAIFTAVFIKLFLMITGGINYLNLFLRVVSFLIQGGVAVFLYKTLRKDWPLMEQKYCFPCCTISLRRNVFMYRNIPICITGSLH